MTGVQTCALPIYIILEGDRFCRAKDIEWLLSEHDAKIYILKVSPEVESERHTIRGDEQSEKWLQTRRTLISNLQTNFLLMGELEIRLTDTWDSIRELKNEIKENLI